MKSWLRIAAVFACGFCAHNVGAADAARALTPTDLNLLARVSDPQVSPDGRRVVYVQRETDLPANRGRSDLWLVDLDAENAKPRRLTQHSSNDTHPRWTVDGTNIYFLSSRTGSQQIWRLPLNGGEAVQITDYPLDVSAFQFSSGGGRIALGMEVFPDCADLKCTRERLDAAGKNKASGRSYDRLFIRHWDTWNVGTRSNLFVAPVNADGRAGAPVNVSKTLDADVPSKPDGGDEEFAFSPDGARVVFSARAAGREEPWSTNFDLYEALSDGSGALKNLTAANPAWDTQPVYLGNGDLAWLAMSRPGFEADRFRVKVMHAGQVREVAASWDRSIQHLSVARDGRTLLAVASDLGQTPLFTVDAASGRVSNLSGPGYVGDYSAAPRGAVVLWHDLATPPDLYLLPTKGERRRLTNVNADLLKARALGTFEQFSFKGWNDETVYGYVVNPPGFAKDRKYPLAFIVHGGPQVSFQNHWNWRWNAQAFAARGYAVVFIDFHGSPGYGQAFTDSISQHWGDRPFEDLKKGLAAALQKFPWLDGQRACSLGASYGGYMQNWIEGNWSDGFRCIVNHDGIFDTRSMYYTTEELWFTEWENGGPYYQTPEIHERFNPANYVKLWRTPMLVVHGGQDFRVPDTQGIATFTALQRRGIESRLLYFPDENHWVLKPNNSIQWYGTVLDWLDAHTR
ncbi:MAG TPA: S9 family peptidase [Steroidobacteraceae bacterium]|jgi:dipeptidyl aminopeptidase/acylaminoacyl peptidase|nr:S9 family peptidase [Steroidobacteraceae bacterium]